MTEIVLKVATEAALQKKEVFDRETCPRWVIVFRVDRRAAGGKQARAGRRRAQRPIVDETGLVGLYDIAIEWDPSGGRRSLQIAFRDAGFVLARGRRPYAFVVVEQAP